MPAHVVRQIGHTQRLRKLVEMLEHPRSAGPLYELPLPLGCESREEVVARHARVVHGDKDAEPCPAQAARTFHDLPQHGVRIEACADPQERRRQRGRAVDWTLVLRRAALAGIALGHDSFPPIRSSANNSMAVLALLPMPV